MALLREWSAGRSQTDPNSRPIQHHMAEPERRHVIQSRDVGRGGGIIVVSE